mmetsp:Transcript_7674/g.12904  ORF Transcript_7674/g.12904 Transcript_7674/m.12904 type:complete len:119 (-) Transcript_7674:13-369(-)
MDDEPVDFIANPSQRGQERELRLRDSIIKEMSHQSREKRQQQYFSSPENGQAYHSHQKQFSVHTPVSRSMADHSENAPRPVEIYRKDGDGSIIEMEDDTISEHGYLEATQIANQNMRQ